ncbi:MAG: hypothetical protein E7343_04590 [Clostridiales bacterium]|nr:hypothetical protein [Clostridiales bacterium]
MNMILMLGIVTFLYFFSLTLMCFYREKMNPKFWNVVFVVADVIFFACWNLAGYEKGWMKNRFMTLDNISPMMCTAIGLLFLMSPKTQDCCKCAVTFLSFGMFCAMLISPERAYLFSFDEQADFLYASEALCHMVMALFGAYLILSKQVKLNAKYFFKSAVFVYSVVGFGVLLNFVFNKDFFGMAPYGDYNIYGIRLFGSFWATLAGYLVGIFLVLLFGLQTHWVLSWLVLEKRGKKTETQPNIAQSELQLQVAIVEKEYNQLNEKKNE